MPPKRRPKFTHVKKTRSKSRLTSEEPDKTNSNPKSSSSCHESITGSTEVEKAGGSGSNASPDTPALSDKDPKEEPHILDNSECYSIESELNVSFQTTPVGPEVQDHLLTSGSPLDDINVPSSISGDKVTEAVSLELLREACINIQAFLPNSWMCRVHEGGLDVMMFSRKGQPAVQRNLHFTPWGKVTLSVHCVLLNISDFLKEEVNTAPLTKDTLSVFVDRCVKIVEEIRAYEICAGLDDAEFKDVWSSTSYAKIDSNPYQESRYSETLRSTSCDRLVLVRRWRCKNCQNMRGNVQRRMEFFSKEAHSTTRNDYLSDAQKLKKLEEQHKKLNALTLQLQRKEDKIQKLLETEGIHLSEDIGNDLTNILQEQDLSPAQALFLQQQAKASQTRKSSGMRWHPDMVRFALSLVHAISVSL